MGQMRHQSNSTIEVQQPVDTAFAAVVAAGQEIGKIKEQSKLAGYVVIKTPGKWWPLRNAATVRVALKRQTPNTTAISFESDCCDGEIGFGSAGQAIDMIVKALEKHL